MLLIREIGLTLPSAQARCCQRKDYITHCVPVQGWSTAGPGAYTLRATSHKTYPPLGSHWKRVRSLCRTEALYASGTKELPLKWDLFSLVTAAATRRDSQASRSRQSGCATGLWAGPADDDHVGPTGQVLQGGQAYRNPCPQ
jgi:hypothetical protein